MTYDIIYYVFSWFEPKYWIQTVKQFLVFHLSHLFIHTLFIHVLPLQTLTDLQWPLAPLKIPSSFGLLSTSQHHPHSAISTIFSLLTHHRCFGIAGQAIPRHPSYQTCKSLMQKLSINISLAPVMTWPRIHCQQMTTLIPSRMFGKKCWVASDNPQPYP
jgi:hypothetical protein